MKKLIVFIFANLSIAAVANAGPISSGGGVGVLCATSDQQKLTVLDLYEARYENTKLAKSTGTFEGDYAIGLERIRKLGGDSRPVSAEDLQYFQEMFSKATIFTQETLRPTDDMGLTVSLPKHCRYVQIAVYNDAQDKLILNQDLWNQLSALDQAALFLHETIYKMHRMAFYQDSHQVRRLVRAVLSEDGPKFKGTYDGIKKGEGLICYAGDQSTNTDISFIWQGNRIYLVTFAGDLRIVQTSIRVPVSPEEFKLELTVLEGNQVAEKVVSTAQQFETKLQYLESEIPMSHVTWRQEFRTGEVFRVGMNVNGKTIMLPVTGCFNY